MEVNNKLRVISFNSMYFSARNRVTNDEETARKLLEWIERELNATLVANKYAIIMYHIPHGTFITPLKEETFWSARYQPQYLSILKKYKKCISVIITGHTHMSYLQYLDSSEVLAYTIKNAFDEVKQAQDEDNYFSNTIICRGVSPIFVNKPGFGLYTYKDNFYEYPEYFEEYTFILEKSLNYTGDPQQLWVFLYNSQTDLGIENLSSHGIAKFLKSLAYDPLKLIKYLLFKVGDAFYGTSNIKTLAKHICDAYGISYNITGNSLYECGNEFLSQTHSAIKKK